MQTRLWHCAWVFLLMHEFPKELRVEWVAMGKGEGLGGNEALPEGDLDDLQTFLYRVDNRKNHYYSLSSFETCMFKSTVYLLHFCDHML